ncbi:glycosyltransferase, partial [Pseudomonadota bacterium]
DQRLNETIPKSIVIHRVSALPERIAKWLGISAIGLRAHLYLALAGDRLLSNEKFDLVLFSTTAFPVMTLGYRWLKKFGVPYVLDMQDPWYTSPPSTIQRNKIKSRIMYALHHYMEKKAVPNAAALIAVSQPYIEVLHSEYTSLRRKPAAVIPFGYSASDLEKASGMHLTNDKLTNSGKTICMCAGRISPAMMCCVRTLLNYLKKSQMLGDENNLLNDMTLVFLGTGYQKKRNPEVVVPVARELEVEDRVDEHPDRVPFMDVQHALQEADILLVIGSEDLAYQPSKLYPYLYLKKPLICVAPRSSNLAQQLQGLENVLNIPTDQSITEQDIKSSIEWLDKAVGDNEKLINTRRHSLAISHESYQLAKRECMLFDEAVKSFHE